MNSNDEMMEQFSEIAERKQPVMLLNTYRGVPIHYYANILSVSQGYVALSVHEYQAVCMALEGNTRVQSEHLPEVYLANAVAVDVLKKQAVLTEFVGVGNSVGKRLSMRVQSSEPLDVVISDGENRIEGKVADVSISGMGVYTFAAHIYGDLFFDRNKEVTIEFILPDLETPVTYQGVVTNIIRQQGTFLHRLGFRLSPNPESDAMLEEFITKREEETLRELKRIYNSMCQEREK
jgi:hypothetical protein